MLAAARALLPSRLSALLVALALTGGLPLVEPSHADAEPHRCHCHHGPGEFCLCASCQRSAAAAQEAELEKLPPCHRANARAARGASRPPDRVMWTGCCGNQGPPRATLATAEPFVLPPAIGLPAGRLDEPLGPSRAAGHGLRREPPTPPPRAA